MKFFPDDGDEHIGRHGAPDLRLHRVLARAKKFLDAQMLFDPFEEQLHLPTAFVKRGDGQRRQGRVVGQEHQRLAGLGVFETDTPQMLGIILGDIKSVQRDHLVADHAGGAVLQMDQTAFAYQEVLRQFRECGEVTDMDRGFSLCPRRYRQETTQSGCFALHVITDIVAHPVREIALAAGVYGKGMHCDRGNILQAIESIWVLTGQ